MGTKKDQRKHSQKKDKQIKSKYFKKNLGLLLLSGSIAVLIFIIIFTRMIYSLHPAQAHNSYQSSSASSISLAPFPTLTTTPIPTPPPLTKLTNLKGALLLTDRDNHLLVSDFAGGDVGKLVDGAGLGSAGVSPDGNILYYTQAAGTTETVYEKNFSTQQTAKLFSFENAGKNLDTFFDNAQVSPDQKFVIYSHDHGDISLYNLSDNTTRLLLQGANSCATAARDTCHGYYSPTWSPDGQHVVITEIFYEGATDILINPFAQTIVEKDLKTGGGTAWSPDGKMLAIFGSGYGPGSVYIVHDLDNPVAADVLPDKSPYKYTVQGSGAWTQNKLLFNYDAGTSRGIALYDIATGSVKSILSSTTNDYTIEKMLPDNQTLLYDDSLDNTTNNLWTLNINTREKKQFPVTNADVFEVVP